jgi:hypothetical protein
MNDDKDIWPCGRYEVYDEELDGDRERLNGFHTIEEARELAEKFPGSLMIDRADRFCS